MKTKPMTPTKPSAEARAARDWAKIYGDALKLSDAQTDGLALGFADAITAAQAADKATIARLIAAGREFASKADVGTINRDKFMYALATADAKGGAL